MPAVLVQAGVCATSRSPHAVLHSASYSQANPGEDWIMISHAGLPSAATLFILPRSNEANRPN